MLFDRERRGDEHAVVVLELLLEASQGDGLPTADHAAQGNQVAFKGGALDVGHELPVVLGFIVPRVAQRLREPIMLHDVTPHSLLLTVLRESGPVSAGGRGDASACPPRRGRWTPGRPARAWSAAAPTPGQWRASPPLSWER